MTEQELNMEPFDLFEEAREKEESSLTDGRVWTVYLHIIPENIVEEDHDMYYVGVTSKSVNKRWRKNGKGYIGSKFGNAIQQYGWDNIYHEIIAEHLIEAEASNMEIALIRELHAFGKCGYNGNPGGIPGYKRTPMSDTRIYKQWLKMKERCYLKTCDAYPMNGGLGIKVCDEWLHDFYEFYDWAMATGYTDELFLFRKDKTKDYSPDNCYWTTLKEKAERRDATTIITYNGKTQSIIKWAEEYKIDRSTLLNRINVLHMPIEQALEQPVQKKHYITYNGETHTISEWAKITGIPRRRIASRFSCGWDVDKIFIKEPLNRLGQPLKNGGEENE